MSSDALAQRRDRERDAVEAEVQILAEALAGDLGLEIAVGGRDEADVDRPRGAPADAHDLAALEHAQQLRLQRGGISPISSRNTVPPRAVSSRPGLGRAAPVNAPFS